MKKTKLLTSLAALALVVGLGGCSTGDIYIDMGDVNINGGGESTGENTSEEGTTEDSSEEETTTESTTEGNTSEDTTEDNTSEDETSGNTSSETTPATTIEQLTAVFTLYDDSGAAQSCPSYGGLYFRGTFNGEDNGYWLEDGPFTLLEETTNSKGEVAYTYTFKDVLISDEHEFVVVFTYDGDTPGSPYQLVTKETTKVDLTGDIESGSTIEFDCTNCHNITETYPEKIVDTSNPVADMLDAIKEGENYTLTLEYYDWYSNYYEDESTMLADYYSGDMTVYGHDYFIDMTYTKDAVLLQYYTSYTEWYYGIVYDVELYVNNYTTGTLDPYYVNWDNETVDYTDLVYSSDYVTTGTWQSNFNTLLGLVDYGDHFIKGDSSYNFWYGTMYDYTVNIDSASFLNRLCTYLLDGGNWFYEYSYFASDASSYYSRLGAPDQSATYYEDYGEFDLSLDYFVESVYQSGSSSTGYEYQLVFDSIYAGLFDVGSSSIPNAYSKYLS